MFRIISDQENQLKKSMLIAFYKLVIAEGVLLKLNVECPQQLRVCEHLTQLMVMFQKVVEHWRGET